MPHIEVLQTEKSTAAPGWAYVYDRPVDPSKIAIDPSSGARGKKRAAATQTTTQGELSRREILAVQRRLQELDKDGGSGKDVSIPGRWKEFGVGTEGEGVGTWGRGRKVTTNVRRVLLSEKTFAHHLEDEEARIALVGGREGEGGASGGGARRDSWRAVAAAKKARKGGEDVVMTDAPAVEDEESGEVEAASPPPAKDDPLLEVDVPLPLTADELEELLSQPPLSYNAARAAPPDVNAPPQRKFCEMCGYWGRVKCLKCGSRVCGLECKLAHDQDCSRRYA